MLTLTFFDNFDTVRDVFFDTNGNYDTTDISRSPTQFVFQNNVTGIVTTVSGSGFSWNAQNELISGTITGMLYVLNGTTIGTMTGFSWDGAQTASAIDLIEATGDNSQLMALYSLQDITIDASASVTGVDVRMPTTGSVITSDITFVGSNFSDRLGGGTGDDTIRPGDNGDFDDLIASLGNDTYDFSGVHSGGTQNYYALLYSNFSNGITATINGVTNTGTITSAGSVDTLVDVNRVLDWDTWGVGVIGTSSNDVFNYTMADDTYIEFRGGGGNDTFNINIAGEGIVRLGYNWDGNNSPSTGIVANLGTGVISNDGFGGMDTLNVTGTTFRPIEIRATDHADSIIGSAQNDRFITRGGNDTVDGGGGDNDLVRYDRSGMTSGINLDFAAGTASGMWNGVAFTDSLLNIEEARGSRNFGDTMLGDGSNNRFRGYGGDDYLDGRDGDDRLEGDDGNDTLIGGAGEDRLEGDDGNDSLVGGADNDRLEGGADNDTLVGGDGRDTLYGGSGNDLLDGSTGSAGTQGWGDYFRAGLGQDTLLGHQAHYMTGEGADLSYSDVSGVGGITLVVGANGSGTVVSGTAGLINDTFSYFHYFEGSGDADSMTGSTEDRWQGWVGLAGDDTINGGGLVGDGLGFDELIYNNDHWYGGTGAVTVNFQTGLATDGFGDTDTFSNIDAVRGTSQADTFIGNNTSNFIRYRGLAGNDTITGGTSYDALDYSRDADEGGTAGIIANLIAGTVQDGFGDTDTVSGIDQIYGTSQGDQMTAGSASVEFRGADGNDTLTGGIGDDTLNGGAGADEMHGGGGIDTVSYANASSGVGARLDGGANFGGAAGDVITGVENLVGSSHSDTLVGNTMANYLDGSDGNDTIFGGGGDDTIVGGMGADVMNGQGGNDTVTYDGSSTGVGARLDGVAGWGGAAGDVISGVERLIGSRFADTLVGNALANVLDGNDGNDTIFAGNGDDTLLGSAGADVMNGQGGNDTVTYANSGTGVGARLDGVAGWAGAAGDVISGVERLIGSLYADTLVGNSLANVLEGNDGNDTIFAGGGNDTLIGGAGADAMHGQAGIDTVTYAGSASGVGARLDGVAGWGGAAGDTIFSVENLIGSAFADTLVGNALANVLEGGNGNDTLFAGNGDDTLIGGAGADVMNGQGGTDTVSYAGSAVGVGARLDGTAGWAGAAGDVITGVEVLIGSSFADTFVGNALGNGFLGGDGNDTIYGGGGDDAMDGGIGSDMLFGQAGDDTLIGSVGADRLDGGADNDTVDYSFAGGGVGIRLDGGANFGWASGDTFFNIENLVGGNFNDVLVGNGGAQSLEGGTGNDTIFALGGDDTIIGGEGDDRMYGQGGSDTFVFEEGFGDDTIYGFNSFDNDEEIDLSGHSAFTTLAQMQLDGMISQVGGNVVIDDLLGNTITLTNVNLFNLHEEDFVF